MLYLATASTQPIRDAMDRGQLGLMAQPGNSLGPSLVPGVPWAADNGCFGERWNPDTWRRWLDRQRAHARSCRFAVVPDVVADAAATLVRFEEWAHEVRDRGYPVAFVAQDGLEDLPVPWDDLDVLFIGGSTDWKLGERARGLCVEAIERGKGTHMGRVNSLRRLRLAVVDGYDSVDGTFLAYGPDKNLPRLLQYLRLAQQPHLWESPSPAEVVRPGPELAL